LKEFTLEKAVTKRQSGTVGRRFSKHYRV